MNITSINLFNKNTSIMEFVPRLFVSIFDLPARAKALNMISHTGYYACINCETEGEYKFNKVFYPFVKYPVQRDQKKYELSLKQVLDKEENAPCNKKGHLNAKGIKGPTVLSKNIDILSDVVFDYIM